MDPSGREASRTSPVVYRTLSAYYERILAYPDFFPSLGRQVIGILESMAPDAVNILEVGAGTCPLHTWGLYPAKSKVIYSDLSHSMLAEAPSPKPAHRVAANILALPFKKPFDASLMLLDGINYLLSEGEFSRALAEVFRLLKPGGAFILNTASEDHCRGPLNGAKVTGSLEGCRYTLKCDFDPSTRQFRSAFTLVLEQADHTWIEREEVHVQRVYDDAALRRLASAAGFELERCYRGLEMGITDPHSPHIHYGLRKPLGA